MKKYTIIILFIVVILLVLILGVNNNFIKTDKLYISEVMSKNSYTHKDEDGDYSDYIEIYNGYSYDINLEGYRLSDNELEINKWVFPSVTIKSHEYLIIYASGKDKYDKENKIMHTSFKLNKTGETLLLIDKSGNIINKFTYPKLNDDVSYGYIKNKYGILKTPSPGKSNGTSFLKTTKMKNVDISINEVMTHNKNFNYTHEGYYYDWVELKNNSNEDIEITNLYLSDDINELDKYKIPNLTIDKNGYLLIYLSGDSKYEDNEVFANFKLSDDEKIILSDGEKIIDQLDIVKLNDNVSYGKKDDKWYYFLTPTPGYKNDTAHFESLGGIDGNS